MWPMTSQMWIPCSSTDLLGEQVKAGIHPTTQGTTQADEYEYPTFPRPPTPPHPGHAWGKAGIFPGGQGEN